MYLYGDRTTFPLNENLLQTIQAATDACVTLLETEERRRRAQRAIKGATLDFRSELKELNALGDAVESALQTLPDASAPTGKVTVELRDLVRARLEQARQDAKDRGRKFVERATGRDDAAVVAALERFLSRHQLPHTTWALSWRSTTHGNGCQALVYALMPRGLAATLEVRIPSNSIWAKPVRVRQLGKRLVIRVQRRSWLGGLRMGNEHLDRYYISSVSKTPLQETLVLRRGLDERSAGLRLTFRSGEVEQVLVQSIDGADQPTSDPLSLGGSDKIIMQRLWAEVTRSISTLISNRGHIQLATLNGTPIHELNGPAVIAKALISALGPWVRTISRHSPTPGELLLWRVNEEGQKRALSLNHYEITRRYRHLPASLREWFDGFGLDEGAATPPAADSAPTSAPLQLGRAQPEPIRDSQPARIAPVPLRGIPAPLPVPARPTPAIADAPPIAPLRPLVKLPPPNPPPRPAERPLPLVLRLPPPSTPPARPRLAARKIQIPSTPPPPLDSQSTQPTLRMVEAS